MGAFQVRGYERSSLCSLAGISQLPLPEWLTPLAGREGREREEGREAERLKP